MTDVVIRAGTPADLDALMSMFDAAVAWLAARGQIEQWGTEPWSAKPERCSQMRSLIDTGDLWLAEAASEADAEPVAAMILTREPPPYVKPLDEPELYVHVLVSRPQARHGAGAALLAHARAEAVRMGIGLLRVDCFAGGDGSLVRYYERNGFTRSAPFDVSGWPGQVLEQRLPTAAGD